MRFAPDISLIALPDQYRLNILLPSPEQLLRDPDSNAHIVPSLLDKSCFHAASRLGELRVELLKLYIRRLL